MSENKNQLQGSFEEQAGAPQKGVRDLIYFLRTNKTLWVTALVFMLLLLSAIIILGSIDAAPLSYTLF